jgi:hypothetical protein
MSMDEEKIQRLYASPTVTDRSASVVMIDSAKLVPLIIVLAIISGTAIGLTAFGFWASRQSTVETRMLEYYVVENDGKLVRAGILKPEETWSARKGKTFKPEQEKSP